MLKMGTVSEKRSEAVWVGNETLAPGFRDNTGPVRALDNNVRNMANRLGIPETV